MIKKKGKKLLSLFLALALIVTMIPVSGLTASADTTPTKVISTLTLKYASHKSAPVAGQKVSEIDTANLFDTTDAKYTIVNSGDNVYKGIDTYVDGTIKVLTVTDPTTSVVRLVNDNDTTKYTVKADATDGNTKKVAYDSKNYVIYTKNENGTDTDYSSNILYANYDATTPTNNKPTEFKDAYGNIQKTLDTTDNGSVVNGYTDGYKWQGKTEDSKSTDNTVMASSNFFQYNSSYKLTFKISPVTGYEFATSNFSVSLAGATVTAKRETYSVTYYGTDGKSKTVTVDTGCYIVTVTFDKTNQAVSDKGTIDTLDNPVAGGSLDTEITCPVGTELDKTDGLTWYAGGTESTGTELKSSTLKDYTVKYGTVYTAVIKLVAKDGYQFKKDGSAVTVSTKVTNGIEEQSCTPTTDATTGIPSSVTIIVTYNKTAKAKIKDVEAITVDNVEVSKISSDPADSAAVDAILGLDKSKNNAVINTEAGKLTGMIEWDKDTISPKLNKDAKQNRTYTVQGKLTAVAPVKDKEGYVSSEDEVDITNLSDYKVTATFTVIGSDSLSNPEAKVYADATSKDPLTSADTTNYDSKTGNYITDIYVDLGTVPSGATMYYTKSDNGTSPAEPTANNGTAYDSSRIKIEGKKGEVVTVKIKAVNISGTGENAKSSEVKEFTYTVAIPGDGIEAVAISDITAPVAGQALDTSAAISSTGISAKTATVSWTTGSTAATGNAKYGTAYTATVKLTSDGTNDFNDTTAVTINGKVVTPTISTDKKTLTASITFDATAKAKLTSITAPAAVTVENGKTQAEIEAALPKTVAIVTEDTSVTSASVAWKIDGTYNASNTAASTVKFNGTVTLPTTVDAGSVALTTTITVNVKAATASIPTANLAEGTYETAQTVALSTTETNGTIYYTTDGTDPTTSSTKYEGPITVSETTTIKAITVVEGKENSAVASFTYTIGTSTPEEPSNPSEPTNPDTPAAPELQSQTITTGKDAYKPVYAAGKEIDLQAEASTELTYSSDNAAVVTVDTQGVVTIQGVGTASVTITAAETDTYKAATKVVTFTVKPAVTSVTKVTSKKAARLTVTYKKLKGVTGYRIQYSTSKKFTAATTNTVKANGKATVSKTIKNLTSGRTYYVRVRGVKGDIVGKWSVAKSVKVK